MNNCFYCQINILRTEDYLTCTLCGLDFHIKCLKRPGTPGDFLNDIFFDFTCHFCSSDGKEVFVRQKIGWVMVLVLTLHNLAKKQSGLGHRGFFHWRTHIGFFVEKYWNYLFPVDVSRKKAWLGTVTGTLSNHNPDIFASGYYVLKDAGWWRLAYNQSPKFYWNLIKSISEKKSQKNVKRSLRSPEETIVNDLEGEYSNEAKKFKPEIEIFSRSLPYMGRNPRVTVKQESEVEIETESIQSSLHDFLATELSNSGLLDDFPPLTNTEVGWRNSFSDIDFDLNQANADFDDLGDCFDDLIESSVAIPVPEESGIISTKLSSKVSSKISAKIQNEPEIEETNYEPRVIQVTNYQEIDEEDVEILEQPKKEISIKMEEQSSDENDDYDSNYKVEKSLFVVQPNRTLPWEVDDEPNNANGNFDKNIELMSEYEEKELYRKLKIVIDNEKNVKSEIPPHIRRFYRKLHIRRIRRSSSKPVFSLDVKKHTTENITNHLSRYHQIIESNRFTTKDDFSFHARIAGSFECDLFESPYTRRVLHPFIYRNSKCLPTWLKLMCELQYQVNDEIPSRATIDYCYVRPQHIAPVNSLLQRMFWPGIDMSECLSYPDFSVVALYKKLVIGCAFLVPNVSHNEAYISYMAVRPEWQRAGIASFMLYHLTQTCMGKDVTLHVSATNPAVCLYQKFGFKTEEVILDFYDKYLPIDSTHSRHAFFLRLSR